MKRNPLQAKALIIVALAGVTGGVVACGDLVAQTPAIRPDAPELPTCELDAIATGLAAPQDFITPMNIALDAPTADASQCAACHGSGTPLDVGGSWGYSGGPGWAEAVDILLAREAAKGPDANSLVIHTDGSSGEGWHTVNAAGLDDVRAYSAAFFEKGGAACAVCGDREVTLTDFSTRGIDVMFDEEVAGALTCTTCHGTGSPTGVGIGWGPANVLTADGWHDAVAALSGKDAANDLPFDSYSFYLHVSTAADPNHTRPNNAPDVLAWQQLFAESGGAGCGGGGIEPDIDVGGDGDGDGDIVIPPFDLCAAYQPATPAEIDEKFTFALLSTFPGPSCSACHVTQASGGLQYDATRAGLIAALSPLILAGREEGVIVAPDATTFGTKMFLPADPTHINAAQQAGMDQALIGNQVRQFIDVVRNGVCFDDPNIPPPVCDPIASASRWRGEVAAEGFTTDLGTGFPATCNGCHVGRSARGNGIGWGTETDPPLSDDWHYAATCSVGLDFTNAAFSGLVTDTDLYASFSGGYGPPHADVPLKVDFERWLNYRKTNCADFVCAAP